METIFQAVILAVSAALLSAVLKKAVPEFALSMTLLAVIQILLLLGDGFRSFFQLLRELGTASGIPGELLSPLYKTAAISLVVRLGGSLCRDAGERALEAAVETAGAVCAFLAALPLIREAVELLMGLLL